MDIHLTTGLDLGRGIYYAIHYWGEGGSAGKMKIKVQEKILKGVGGGKWEICIKNGVKYLRIAFFGL